ncbi:MAG TPA: Hpt domain-containing protein [Allosphingosinicella sp.]|jgi:HPt (histidine-containing phosphotransfer) domain-containing protein|nr:Hpt domain-containing protein [Allosphingosinicella sp.]
MSDDIMQSLRLRFCARLTEDIAALQAAAEAGDRAAIRAVCHRMAGAGGMFGFADLSAAASEAEEAVDAGEAGDALSRRVGQVLDLAREATASVCGAE